MSLFQELKRRNVFRVGIAYALVGWLIMQVGEVMAPALQLPDWVTSALAFFLILGFPIALLGAWAFELTPEGLKRDSGVSDSPPTPARRFDGAILALLLLAIGYILWDRYVLDPKRDRVIAESIRKELPTADAENAPSTKTAASDATIAVLPFVNMSADPAQEYFSDGIAEELLNLLVRVEGLEVASRTSSFVYKNQTSNIPAIAVDLGVANILEGSVRKAGNRVRITAQLIDAVQDRHLWSETYDRELDDIFAIQEDIATAIVQALRTELELDALPETVEVPVATRNMDAYDLYLQAHARFIGRRELDLAVRQLEEAVVLDPAFATAWEALAATAAVAPGWGHEERDYRSIAMAAAERAVAIDSKRSMAWAVRGTLEADPPRRNLATGMALLDRAIEEDPDNATAWLWRGVQWSKLGFHDRARDDIRECLAVDPAYVLCFYHLGLVESLLGNPQGLRDNTERLLAAGFDHHIDQHTLFLGAQGDHLAAHLMTRLMPPDLGYPADAFLAAMRDPQGDHSEGLAAARTWLGESTRRVGTAPTLLLALGGWDALPENDGAWPHWIWLQLHPEFRASSAFKRLVRGYGIDQYWREQEYPPQCGALAGEDFECGR